MNAGNVTQAAGGTLGMGAGLSSLGVSLGPAGWAALAAANLIPSILGSSQQNKQRRYEQAVRAAEIEASPWSGRGPTTQVGTPESNVWMNLLGAGSNVLGQGISLQSDLQKAKWGDLINKGLEGMDPKEAAMLLLKGQGAR
jgi:hypothetical protein